MIWIILYNIISYNILKFNYLQYGNNYLNEMFDITKKFNNTIGSYT